jgi:putative DNA primase/helicase
VALYGRDIRYSTQAGWHVWDGARWAQSETGAIERLAKSTVETIYSEAAACKDVDRWRALMNHARRSESNAKLKAMLEVAQSEREVVLRHEDFDTDESFLTVSNGTFDLTTAELRPHSRDDLITKLIPINYQPDAICSTWLSFLQRVTDGDIELIDFLQRCVGYSLTGSTREQCFFILYGTGANGKSTFLNIISELAGDYAKRTRTETLLVRGGNQIPNDVARLAGARFVSAVETESNRQLAEGLVKQMTGGDKLSARFLHREYFEFFPRFKVVAGR